MTIGDNILHFGKVTRERNCVLVAISKTRSTEDILQAYQAGQRDFGENRSQEMALKYNELPRDIRWHMVGHLQTNKVKLIAPFVSLIHSVDSLKLLNEINRQGENTGRIISCLLQIHIAEEETKYGFDQNELFDLLKTKEAANLSHIGVKGLMGMATLTDEREKIRREFRNLKSLFEMARSENHFGNFSFEILSMGMSGDVDIALEEGSNMVRIGTAIFGDRN